MHDQQLHLSAAPSGNGLLEHHDCSSLGLRELVSSSGWGQSHLVAPIDGVVTPPPQTPPKSLSKPHLSNVGTSSSVHACKETQTASGPPIVCQWPSLAEANTDQWPIRTLLCPILIPNCRQSPSAITALKLEPRQKVEASRASCPVPHWTTTNPVAPSPSSALRLPFERAPAHARSPSSHASFATRLPNPPIELSSCCDPSHASACNSRPDALASGQAAAAATG
ncbi:hypothetical protein CC78DRAFT_577532 [Lojkania enalia]|uniref:Uncharacterized protein n=1 Tax=Lojkania enalia TaxID=147567 RepID=A0A9P4N5F7_9PLEO|nr:hypothetical protein CC78DRAFT_577532 [Didymosphaeria enalia]